MLKYITREEYFELLGKSVPDNFEKLVIEASEYINYRTFGRIDENNIPEKVKYATCLVIDNLKLKELKVNEVQNLKSESVEGWSKTYATPQEINLEFDNKNYEILRQYLWNVVGKDGKPLLYVGVC